MRNAKQEIITFKADQSLIDVMQGVPNRSEFIREALLAALDGVCPLCRGERRGQGKRRDKPVWSSE